MSGGGPIGGGVVYEGSVGQVMSETGREVLGLRTDLNDIKSAGGGQAPVSSPREAVDANEDMNVRRERWLSIYFPGNRRSTIIFRYFVAKSLDWILAVQAACLVLPALLLYAGSSDFYKGGHKAAGLTLFGFFQAISLLAIISATFILIFELKHHIVKLQRFVTMYFAITM